MPRTRQSDLAELERLVYSKHDFEGQRARIQNTRLTETKSECDLDESSPKTNAFEQLPRQQNKSI
jgi:hypothetical protein